MTDYTIYAKNAMQWGKGVAALLHDAESIEEIDHIRAVHRATAEAVAVTHPKIIDRIKEIVAQRKSMLAQSPVDKP